MRLMTHTVLEKKYQSQEPYQMLNLKIGFLINSASLPAPLDHHSAVWREAVQLCRTDHRPVAMVYFLRLWLSAVGTGMM